MAATARDLTRSSGRHWAARPLPEPPRTRRDAKSLRGPIDRLGHQLEDWLRELTIGNTIEGD